MPSDFKNENVQPPNKSLNAFPGDVEISSGTVAIGERYKIENGVRTCTVYSESKIPEDTDQLFQGGCGSFYSTNTMKSLKDRIDDAFSVILTDNYPITLIADGAYLCCDPAEIQEVCNDGEVIFLAKMLQQSIIAIYAEYRAHELVHQQDWIKDHIKTAAITFLHEVELRIRKVASSSHMTLSVAIPFEATTKDGQALHKIVTFGVGNDLILHVPAESKTHDVTVIKGPQKFIAEKSGGTITDVQLIDPNATANAEIKSDNTYQLDKVFIPPLEYVDQVAMRFVPVNIIDFAEGDYLIATTDCASMLYDYSQKKLTEVSELLAKIKANDLKDYPQLQSMTADNLKTFYLALEKAGRVSQYNSVADLLNSDKPITALQELFNSIQNISNILRPAFPAYEFGDDIAFCKIKLDRNQTRNLAWRIVANDKNVLTKIMLDNDYWRSKKHGAFRWGVPKGLGAIQEKLSASSHITQDKIVDIIKEVALARKTQVPVNENRDPVTEKLYDLGKIPLQNWATAPEFQSLYSDWYQWNQSKNRHDNIRQLYFNPVLAAEEKEQLISAIKKI